MIPIRAAGRQAGMSGGIFGICRIMGFAWRLCTPRAELMRQCSNFWMPLEFVRSTMKPRPAASRSPKLSVRPSKIELEERLMRPRDLVQAWVDAFNRADVDALANLYSEDATNHQVAESPVQGREAIRRMFADGFASAKMVCIVENLFQDGEWAILEWRDPLGLRGCGFFHVVDGKIVFQRGYWDKLTFRRLQGAAPPR